ncbi:hypothetical protein K1T71_004526 [Dendrolimus kikuchii]|uniref:Uncharacterized protein n=1 Tax=Dendrolimus kikuchii TaxID=765133 RepID=A0ACC1D7W8_9NEOP|nr:hypothetical protein K1T71_004526 [Dendrolimus kikuchii]
MEAQNKEALPQVGRSSSREEGESHPVAGTYGPCRSPPSYSGGGGGAILRSTWSLSKTRVPEMGGEAVFTRSSSRTSGRTSAMSCAASGTVGRGTEESDSNASVFSIRSRSRSRSRSGSEREKFSEPSNWRLRKKRLRPAPYHGPKNLPASSGEESHVSKAPRRVSPPAEGTSDASVSLARAKEAVLQAARSRNPELEDHEVRATELIRAAEEARIARQAPELLGHSGSITDEAGAKTAHAIETDVRNALGVIRHVAKVPRGLKGTFVKSLNDSVGIISDAFEVLRGRTESQEIRRLEAANRRLENEVKEMRAEMAGLRAEITRARHDPPPPPPPPPPKLQTRPQPQTSLPAGQQLTQEELLRHLTLSIGKMVDAKLAALDDRLLPEKRVRPPLTADARRASTQSPATSGRRIEDSSAADFPPLPPSKGRGRGSKGSVAQKVAVPPVPAPRTQAQALEEGWSVVARKKKKGKPPAKTNSANKAPTPKPRPKPSKPAAAHGPRLKEPNATAVVLTLLPAAVEKGLSYADVMAKAKSSIRLGDLGIAGLKLKTARTGARMLLLPGRDNFEKADALAAKLKSVLPEEEVRVSRPEKCVNVRISGLDDFTTANEVMAAVARVTDHRPERFSSSAMRLGPDKLGYVIVSCPVAAAKKLKDQTLMVGWASAGIKILPNRSERCWRCLVAGHVACTCSSPVDRSRDCYRCGQPGHLAATCSSPPHCSICAAAGKAAGHWMCRGVPAARKSAVPPTTTTAITTTTDTKDQEETQQALRKKKKKKRGGGKNKKKAPAEGFKIQEPPPLTQPAGPEPVDASRMEE